MVKTPPRLERHRAFNFGDSPEDVGKAPTSAVGVQLSSPQLTAKLESMSGACDIRTAATDSIVYNLAGSPLLQPPIQPEYHVVCDGRQPPRVCVDMSDWESVDENRFSKTCSSITRLRRNGPGHGSPGVESSQKPKYVPPKVVPVNRAHVPLRSLVRAHMTELESPELKAVMTNTAPLFGLSFLLFPGFSAEEFTRISDMIHRFGGQITKAVAAASYIVGKGRQFRQSRASNPGWSVPVLDEARLVELINSGLRAQHAAASGERSRSKSPRPSIRPSNVTVDSTRGRRRPSVPATTPTTTRSSRSTSHHSERSRASSLDSRHTVASRSVAKLPSPGKRQSARKSLNFEAQKAAIEGKAAKSVTSVSTASDRPSFILMGQFSTVSASDLARLIKLFGGQLCTSLQHRPSYVVLGHSVAGSDEALSAAERAGAKVLHEADVLAALRKIQKRSSFVLPRTASSGTENSSECSVAPLISESSHSTFVGSGHITTSASRSFVLL